MRLLRIASVLIFLLSLLGFSGYRIYETGRIDEAAPEIVFDEAVIPVSIHIPREELLQGITAYDGRDGDVTASLIIESISKFTNSGKRIVTYAAFDSSFNIAKAEREMVYTDYTPPRFSLLQPMKFVVGDTVGVLNGVKVTDCIDGDLSDKLQYESQSFSFGLKEGIYPIRLEVTNSAGDTAVLPVDVVFYYPDYESQYKTPEISLSEYLTYIKAGEAFDAGAFLKGAVIGQEEYAFQADRTEDGYIKYMSKSAVTITSDVDPGTPGIYHVQYSLTATNGYTGTAGLIVIVEG